MSLRPLLGTSKISPSVGVYSRRCSSPLLVRPPPRLHQHYIRNASTLRQQPRIQRSAFNWTSVVVCVGVGATVGLTVGIYKGFTSSEPHTEEVEGAVQVFDDGMAVQMPKGRPGSLTPEEEAKLRELWRLVLQLSGVLEASPASPNGKSQSPALSRTTSESSTGEKKKKKRLSLFKKKKDHMGDVPEAARSTPASQSAPESGKQLYSLPVTFVGNSQHHSPKHRRWHERRQAQHSLHFQSRARRINTR